MFLCLWGEGENKMLDCMLGTFCESFQEVDGPRYGKSAVAVT